MAAIVLIEMALSLEIWNSAVAASAVVPIAEGTPFLIDRPSFAPTLIFGSLSWTSTMFGCELFSTLTVAGALPSTVNAIDARATLPSTAPENVISIVAVFFARSRSLGAHDRNANFGVLNE